MGQKHKRFQEFRTPFFPARHPRKSSQHVSACAAGDGAICSKNRKIVPYHGANPNTRNGAHLRSPSPIMAPGKHLMTGPKRNIESCFPKTLNVSRGGAEVNIELQRNRCFTPAGS